MLLLSPPLGPLCDSSFEYPIPGSQLECSIVRPRYMLSVLTHIWGFTMSLSGQTEVTSGYQLALVLVITSFITQSSVIIYIMLGWSMCLQLDKCTFSGMGAAEGKFQDFLFSANICSCVFNVYKSTGNCLAARQWCKGSIYLDDIIHPTVDLDYILCTEGRSYQFILLRSLAGLLCGK